MIEEGNADAPKRRYRWPWFLLSGVMVFFFVSVMWLMVAVERVKRNKASTMELTNSHTSPTPTNR